MHIHVTLEGKDCLFTSGLTETVLSRVISLDLAETFVLQSELQYRQRFIFIYQKVIALEFAKNAMLYTSNSRDCLLSKVKHRPFLQGCVVNRRNVICGTRKNSLN